VRSRLHHHLTERAVLTLLGWRDPLGSVWTVVGGDPLPGSEPEVFFAPAQIEKRDAEWGRGVMMGKAYAASIELVTQRLAPTLAMESHSGCLRHVMRSGRRLLENQISGQRGVMLTLRTDV
jgi:hypothetical protein